MNRNLNFVSISKQFRLFSTSSKLSGEVRVRFAPSPTGSIHLGGLRTALYNYLFAKKHGGKFILRIEDTDRTRLVPESIDDIQATLDWAGLQRNEGPRESGPYGPYLQSDRIDIYKQKADELLDAGKAYRCFCSPTRLELLRKQQVRNREPPHYDGKCRHLSREEIEEKLLENDGRHVIRFALLSGQVYFDDIIFGNICNNVDANIDSDPVIMKSDGYPTYHFANVVDDHTMRISHVLRGSEWISSTTKHLLIYKAFEWDPPRFAHFPLITMKDGSKMSKRDNHSNVKFWVDSGYRPLALINFLTNMGGGLPKHKQDTHEIWDLAKIAENFQFDQVSCHPSSVDLSRLKIFNAKDLQLSWNQDPTKLIEEFKILLHRNSMRTDMQDDKLIEIVGTFVNRIDTLNELISTENAYIWHPPQLTWTIDQYKDKGWDLNSIINHIIESLNSMDELTKESLDKQLRSIARQHGIEWPALFRLVRKILTNNDRGLPVHAILTVLGKPRSIQYLESGLKYIASL